jgi:hypothetical protein
MSRGRFPYSRRAWIFSFARATTLVAIVAAILATGLAGCQQLFTTSLGKALARDSLPVPKTLTTSQASDLVAQAKADNDTKLATTLVTNLVNQIATTTDATEKAELQASAATAAVTASGTSDALSGILSDYGDTGEIPTDSATLTELLTTIQSGATASVVAALSYLDPGSGGIDATQAEAAGLGATDLAIAAVVIAASAMPAGVDPTTVVITDLPAEDQATIEVAKSIIVQANTMVEAGSASADLLNSLISRFQLQASP